MGLDKTLNALLEWEATAWVGNGTRLERGPATTRDERWAREDEGDRCFLPKEDKLECDEEGSESDIIFFERDEEKSEFGMTVFEYDKRDEEGREFGMTIFKCDKEEGMTVPPSFVALQVTNCRLEKAAVTEAETCDEEAREFAIFISLDFVLPYGVSICFDSIAPKRDVEARGWDEKGRESGTAFFLIWGLTNEIALMADACSLGLLESSVVVDWDRCADAIENREVGEGATKSEEIEKEAEGSKERLPESRTASCFLGLYFVKGSWEATVRGWDEKREESTTEIFLNWLETNFSWEVVVRAELPEICESGAGEGGDEPDTELSGTSDSVCIQSSVCIAVYTEHTSGWWKPLQAVPKLKALLSSK